MSKILVALDGSPASEKALDEAVKLAQHHDGQVAAVAVLDRSGDPHLERLAEGIKTRARQHLERVLQAAANFARSRGVQLTPLLREGHPADAILACPEEEGVGLLIVGADAARPAPG